MYGIKGQGWCASIHVFTHYVTLIFLKGSLLQPAPAGGLAKEARWVDIREHGMDAAQLTRWLLQAAALPGWGPC